MAKKRRKRRGLASYAEEFAISLIYEASGSTIGRVKNAVKNDGKEENPVSFRDRRALLDSITKILGAQDPPDDDEEDGIASFRERLNDGDSGEAQRGTGGSDET